MKFESHLLNELVKFGPQGAGLRSVREVWETVSWFVTWKSCWLRIRHYCFSIQRIYKQKSRCIFFIRVAQIEPEFHIFCKSSFGKSSVNKKTWNSSFYFWVFFFFHDNKQFKTMKKLLVSHISSIRPIQ